MFAIRQVQVEEDVKITTMYGSCKTVYLEKEANCTSKRVTAANDPNNVNKLTNLYKCVN